MNFYFIGDTDGFNELRFPNVEDWQNCMGHAKGISESWIPPKLEYIYGEKSKRDKNFDLSQCCNPMFTISERALSVLGDILTKNGEILDIESPQGFYFFHCTNIVDALIEEESGVDWMDKELNWIKSIDQFVLDKSKLIGQSIFVIPNGGYRYVFFCEEFKQFVEKNKLKGIHFNRGEIIIVR
jgi:hypothetical protein